MTPASIRRLEGRGLPLRGRDVDTDRIMPARFLRAITFDGLEAHVFEDDRRAFAARNAAHPFDNPKFRGSSILIVESNFGCGSSREHAPQALRRWGIRAIVGESFAEIFRGNGLMLGLPCVTADALHVARLLDVVEASPGSPITIDLDAMRCIAGSTAISIAMPTSLRAALRSGTWDQTALLLNDFAQVERVDARLRALALQGDRTS